MADHMPRTVRVADDLPECWLRPQPSTQATLFPRPTDEVLTDLGVSRGDVRKWRDLGWIAFDVDVIDRLDQPEEWELGFVRSLARSSLSIRQIDELLVGLDRPLRYDPARVAFHFAHGWVVPRPEDPFAIVDREVEDWIASLRQDGDTDRLQALAELINDALGGDDSEEP